jgi:DNA polymerase-3 subunit beta
MEIHIERDIFFKGLQMVQNIIEPRQTLPILANVLLETHENVVRVTATDLEVGARVSVPARIVSPGAITISARKLSEIVKELPALTLSMKVQENLWVALRCGGVAYKLAGLPPGDYPSVEEGSPPGWVRMKASTFRDMISQTSFAVSHDESRYALNGVFFSFQEKEIRLVATDGHRLALSFREVTEGGGNWVGIVPRKAIQEVNRVLAGTEEVQFALVENRFVLKTLNFLLTARLIEGQFPNYEQVLPKEHPKRVALSREAFSAALRRVSVLSEERTKPVKLLLSPGSLKVTAYNPELGEAEETMDAEYSGEEVTIGFNSRYLLDALSPLEADRVVVELKDGLSPGVIKSLGEEGSACVIMPMRV